MMKILSALLFLTCIFSIQGKHRVAFSVYLSKAVTLGNDQTVKYDRILTNTGGAYKKYSGHFVAPYTGMYTISSTMMSRSGYQVRLDIVKNFQVICSMYGDSGSKYPQSSQTFHIWLKKGDNVWVKNKYGSGRILHDRDGGIYNSFSGILNY